MRSVFVSSTFRDMQSERDIIYSQIFPKLRQLLRTSGEEIESVDLRWGVDTMLCTEEESGHMVIRTCLDTIDRCRPYIIVLLGERYGWIPGSGLLETLHDSRFAPFCSNPVSITELEIRYGVLSEQADMAHCVFCFRDPGLLSEIPAEYRQDYASESDAHREKLDALKAVIRSDKQARIIEYSAEWDAAHGRVAGLSDFTEQLEKALLSMMREDGLLTDRARTPIEQYILETETYTAGRSRLLCARPGMERQITDLLETGRQIWITAPEGSGKTSFMLREAGTASRFGCHSYFYFGDRPGAESSVFFLDWLLHRLSVDEELRQDADFLYIDAHAGISDKVKYFERLLQRLCRRVLVFVDGVDQMDAGTAELLVQLMQLAEGSRHSSSYSAHPEPWLQFIAASACFPREAARLCSADPDSTLCELAFAPPSDSEIEAMVDRTAARRGKALDAAVINRIREKPLGHNPLYVSLLLQRLFMMDQADFDAAAALAPGISGLSRYLCRLTDQMGNTLPEAVREIAGKAVQMAADGLPARMPGQPESTLGALIALLAVSRHGLSSAQIARITASPLPPVVTEHLFSLLYDILEEGPDGRWAFRHQVIRDAILQSTPDAERERLRRLIIEKTAGELPIRTLFSLAAESAALPLGGLLAERLSGSEEDRAQILTEIRERAASDGVDTLTARLLRGQGAERTAEFLLHEAAADRLPLTSGVIRLLEALEHAGGDWPAQLSEQAQFDRCALGVEIGERKMDYRAAARWADAQLDHYRRLRPGGEHEIRLMQRIISKKLLLGYHLQRAFDPWDQAAEMIREDAAHLPEDFRKACDLEQYSLVIHDLMSLQHAGKKDAADILDRLIKKTNAAMAVSAVTMIQNQLIASPRQSALRRLEINNSLAVSSALENALSEVAYNACEQRSRTNQERLRLCRTLYQQARDFESGLRVVETIISALSLLEKADDDALALFQEALDVLMQLKGAYDCPLLAYLEADLNLLIGMRREGQEPNLKRQVRLDRAIELANSIRTEDAPNAAAQTHALVAWHLNRNDSIRYADKILSQLDLIALQMQSADDAAVIRDDLPADLDLLRMEALRILGRTQEAEALYHTLADRSREEGAAGPPREILLRILRDEARLQELRKLRPETVAAAEELRLHGDRYSAAARRKKAQSLMEQLLIHSSADLALHETADALEGLAQIERLLESEGERLLSTCRDRFCLESVILRCRLSECSAAQRAEMLSQALKDAQITPARIGYQLPDLGSADIQLSDLMEAACEALFLLWDCDPGQYGGMAGIALTIALELIVHHTAGCRPASRPRIRALLLKYLIPIRKDGNVIFRKPDYKDKDGFGPFDFFDYLLLLELLGEDLERENETRPRTAEELSLLSERALQIPGFVPALWEKKQNRDRFYLWRWCFSPAREQAELARIEDAPGKDPISGAADGIALRRLRLGMIRILEDNWAQAAQELEKAAAAADDPEIVQSARAFLYEMAQIPGVSLAAAPDASVCGDISRFADAEPPKASSFFASVPGAFLAPPPGLLDFWRTLAAKHIRARAAADPAETWRLTQEEALLLKDTALYQADQEAVGSDELPRLFFRLSLRAYHLGKMSGDPKRLFALYSCAMSFFHLFSHGLERMAVFRFERRMELAEGQRLVSVDPALAGRILLVSLPGKWEHGLELCREGAQDAEALYAEGLRVSEYLMREMPDACAPEEKRCQAGCELVYQLNKHMYALTGETEYLRYLPDNEALRRSCIVGTRPVDCENRNESRLRELDHLAMLLDRAPDEQRPILDRCEALAAEVEAQYTAAGAMERSALSGVLSRLEKLTDGRIPWIRRALRRVTMQQDSGAEDDLTWFVHEAAKRLNGEEPDLAALEQQYKDYLKTGVLPWD